MQFGPKTLSCFHNANAMQHNRRNHPVINAVLPLYPEPAHAFFPTLCSQCVMYGLLLLMREKPQDLLVMASFYHGVFHQCILFETLHGVFDFRRSLGWFSRAR